MREEVALVAEVAGTHRAHQLEAGVEAVAAGHHVRAVHGAASADAGAQDRTAVHVVRHRQAGHRQGGGGQVEGGDRLLHHRPRRRRSEVLPARREAHDQRHVVALLPPPVLGAQHAGAVVGPEHHDGVVPQPILVQFGHVAPDVVVDLGHRVVVARPRLAELGDVGVIGRQRRLLGIVEVVRLQQRQALGQDRLVRVLGHERVALGVVVHGEERLACPPLPPVRAAAPGIPCRGAEGGRRVALRIRGAGQVVVGLDAVGGEVAGVAQVGGQQAQVLGRGYRGAVVVGAEGERHHPGDDGRAGHGAHRRHGVGIGVANALGGQRIEVGRPGVAVAVAAEQRIDVFDRHPQDVGPAGRAWLAHGQNLAVRRRSPGAPYPPGRRARRTTAASR